MAEQKELELDVIIPTICIRHLHKRRLHEGPRLGEGGRGVGCLGGEQSYAVACSSPAPSGGVADGLRVKVLTLDKSPMSSGLRGMARGDDGTADHVEEDRWWAVKSSIVCVVAGGGGRGSWGKGMERKM